MKTQIEQDEMFMLHYLDDNLEDAQESFLYSNHVGAFVDFQKFAQPDFLETEDNEEYDDSDDSFATDNDYETKRFEFKHSFNFMNNHFTRISFMDDECRNWGSVYLYMDYHQTETLYYEDEDGDQFEEIDGKQKWEETKVYILIRALKWMYIQNTHKFKYMVHTNPSVFSDHRNRLHAKVFKHVVKYLSSLENFMGTVLTFLNNCNFESYNTTIIDFCDLFKSSIPFVTASGTSYASMRDYFSTPIVSKKRSDFHKLLTMICEQHPIVFQVLCACHKHHKPTKHDNFLMMNKFPRDNLQNMLKVIENNKNSTTYVIK
jgi:rubredoxin